MACLAAIFSGLNVLDGLLTKVALVNGYEANPIMRLLLSYPDWAFWTFKVVAGIAVVLILWKLRFKYPTSTRRMLTMLTVAMAIVCLWNVVGLAC
jgi:uncharacterized membrane protein